MALSLISTELKIPWNLRSLHPPNYGLFLALFVVAFSPTNKTYVLCGFIISAHNKKDLNISWSLFYGAHDGVVLEPLTKLLKNVKTQQYQQIETNLNRLFAWYFGYFEGVSNLHKLT